jgi:long-chain acyl-CoA synthetase
MNLAKLAEEAVQRQGERMILDFEGEQFTNVQMLDWARRLQRIFSRLGLRRGDIAAMYLFNHPLVYPVFGGIFRTGATALPVMFLLTPPELRYVLADSRAKGVITDGMGIDKVREAIEGLDHIEWILVRGGEDAMEASPPEYRLETLLEDDPEKTLSDIDEDDVALMLYTAGTTGKPKGVMLTHSNLYACCRADWCNNCYFSG